MENKHIYVLAKFDEDTNSHSTDVYHKLNLIGLTGEQTPNLPYHITLGRFNTGEEGQVLKRVEEVGGAVKAFDIRLSHIGLFGLNVLFIAPAVNSELLMLHDAVVPHESVSGAHNWVAHVTMLIDEPDAIQRALPVVARSFSPITATIDSIGVYEFFPERFIKNVNLSS